MNRAFKINGPVYENQSNDVSGVIVAATAFRLSEVGRVKKMIERKVRMIMETVI